MNIGISSLYEVRKRFFLALVENNSDPLDAEMCVIEQYHRLFSRGFITKNEYDEAADITVALGMSMM